MDVAILPSRGASLETAAKGARAASSPPSVSGGFAARSWWPRDALPGEKVVRDLHMVNI